MMLVSGKRFFCAVMPTDAVGLLLSGRSNRLPGVHVLTGSWAKTPDHIPNLYLWCQNLLDVETFPEEQKKMGKARLPSLYSHFFSGVADSDPSDKCERA